MDFLGLPGGKGPDKATEFVLPRQPFADGTDTTTVLRQPLIAQTPRRAADLCVNVIANLLLTTLAAVIVSLPPGKQQTTSAPQALFQVGSTQPTNLLETTLAPAPAPSFPVGEQQLTSAPAALQYLPLDTSRGTPKTLTQDTFFAPANLTESMAPQSWRQNLLDTSQGTPLPLRVGAPPPPPFTPPAGLIALSVVRLGLDTTQSSPRVLLTQASSPFVPSPHFSPVKYWWQPQDTSQSSPISLLAVITPPFVPAQHFAPVQFSYQYADTSQSSPQPLIASPAVAVPFVPQLIGALQRLVWQPADTSQSTPKTLYADATRPFVQSDFPPPVNYRRDSEYHELSQSTNPNLFPAGPPVPPPPAPSPTGGGGKLWPPMAMERAIRKEEARVEAVHDAQINVAAEKALDKLKVDKKPQKGPKSDDDDDDDALLLLS